LRNIETSSTESAGMNAGLAIAAPKLAEPYLKDGYKKLKDKKKWRHDRDRLGWE
jgi:hypothetical protein